MIEMTTFGIFIIMILGMICFMSSAIFANKTNNHKTDNNVIIRNVDNKQEIDTTKCYENGEITNLCAIIALKNLLRDMDKMLSPIEKDALKKGVDNTMTVEKLKAFIDNKDNEYE